MIPEEAVQAAAEAIGRALWAAEDGCLDEELALVALKAAAPILAEHVAGLFAAVAARYPEGIWPSESDAFGALAMRHAYGQAGIIARQAFPPAVAP